MRKNAKSIGNVCIDNCNLENINKIKERDIYINASNCCTKKTKIKKNGLSRTPTPTIQIQEYLKIKECYTNKCNSNIYRIKKSNNVGADASVRPQKEKNNIKIFGKIKSNVLISNIKHSTSNSAITLIALIITIIVLLILAGVSIQALIDTELFNKAKRSSDEYNESSAKERAEILISEFVINNETEGKNLEEFLNEKKTVGVIDDVRDNQDETITIEIDGFEVLIDSAEAKILDIVDMKKNNRTESKIIPSFEISAKTRVGKIVIDYKEANFDESNVVKYEIYVDKRKIGETNSLPYNIIGEEDKTYSNIKVIAVDRNNEIKTSDNTLNVTMYHDIVSLVTQNLQDKDLLVEIFSDKPSMEKIASDSKVMSAICESSEARNALYDAHDVTEEVLANSSIAINAMKASSRCETRGVIYKGTDAGGSIYSGKAFVLNVWMNSDLVGASSYKQYHGMYIIGDEVLSMTPTGKHVPINKFASKVSASLNVASYSWFSTAYYFKI